MANSASPLSQVMIHSSTSASGSGSTHVSSSSARASAHVSPNRLLACRISKVRSAPPYPVGALLVSPIGALHPGLRATPLLAIAVFPLGAVPGAAHVETRRGKLAAGWCVQDRVSRPPGLSPRAVHRRGKAVLQTEQCRSSFSRVAPGADTSVSRGQYRLLPYRRDSRLLEVIH